MTRWNALRCLASVLTAVAVLSATAGSASAQSIPVTVGGQTSSLVGVEFDVPIEIDLSARGELLGSYALTVRWNPSVLALTGAQAGAFGEAMVNEDSVLSGVLLATGVNTGGMGGRFIVGMLRFQPIVGDTTTLRLSVQELYAAQTFADLTPFAAPADRQFCPALGRFGDLDRDGAANSRDALIALSASIGLDLPEFQVAMGDVDANGSTEARDALIILSHSVGLDVSQFRVFTIAAGTCVVPTATTLVLDPGDVTVTVGQEIVYTAVATDAAGNATAVTDVFWSSDAPSVAAVLPSGLVGAVGEGTAKITVVRSGGDSASATVTVVGGRQVYWVDALALSAVNQLGSPALPFGSIQAAADVAAEGDTIRVRPGRYAESATFERGVVVEGDTTGGALRPLLSIPGSGVPSFTVVGGQRFELHNFRSDSLYMGLYVEFADSVLVRNVEFRQCVCGSGQAISVDTVSALEIEQSQFVGVGGYYDNAIEVSIGAGLVRLDSSRVAEFGASGLYLIGVDSVDIRHSTLEHIGSNGVYACGVCGGLRATALVFSENRLRDIGAVYVDGYRSAQFDRNVSEPGLESSSGVYLDNYDLGPGVGIATFLGDSLVAERYDYPLYVRGYDSLIVDRMYAVGDGAWFDNGRHTVIRDSKFHLVSGDYGLRIDPGDLDSATVTGVLQNVEVLGPDVGDCDRCYSGIELGWGHFEVDGITVTNFGQGLEVWDATATIRNAMIDHTYYGVESDCGNVKLNGLQITDTDYGVYGYACEPTDSIVVDSSTVSARNGNYYSEGTAVVRWSAFSGGGDAIEAYDTDLYTEGNRIEVQGGNYGLYFRGAYYYGSDSLYVASFAQDTITCTGSGSGIYAYHGAISVTGAVVTDCSYGMRVGNTASQLPLATPLVIRSSTITIPPGANYGIYATGNDRADLELVGNTVTGPSISGAIYTDPWSDLPRLIIDSNTVDGALGTGILARDADTVRMRWNTVTNLGPGSSTAGGATAILLAQSDAADAIAEVRGNRVTGGTGSGIRLYRSVSTDTVTVIVDSNVVQGVDSMGIWVSYYSRAQITRNAIDGVGLDAVYVDRSSNDSAAFAINNNNFTNSGRYGVYNRDAVTADASNNWWNDAAGPSGFYGNPQGLSTGDSVSANVGWSPYLESPEGSAPTPAPPAILAAIRARAASMSPAPADATAVASEAQAEPDDELAARLRAYQELRDTKVAERAERDARVRASRAEADAERAALRQEAQRRRAEALARGGGQ